MIVGKTFFKRDDVLHARIPGEIKQSFQILAKEKGKTVSEYVLELVLEELYREEENAEDHLAKKKQNPNNYDE